MNQNKNKATDLLDMIGVFTFKYLDYIGLYIILPFIFSVSYTDYRVFVVIGAVIICSAISTDGLGLFVRLKNNKTETKPDIGSEFKDTDSTSTLAQQPNTQLWLHEFSEKFSVVSDTVKGINFPKLGEIKVHKISDTEILIFTKDYRAIRLSRDEINQFYLCLIESECTFFREGAYEVEITIKKQKK